MTKMIMFQDIVTRRFDAKRSNLHIRAKVFISAITQFADYLIIEYEFDLGITKLTSYD